MAANRLQQILAVKEQEVARVLPRAAHLRAAALERNDFRSFARALDLGPEALGLIAEVKKASPSAGVIAEAFDPVTMLFKLAPAAVGVALVAEVMPDRARPYALGLLQALSAVGNFGAALIGIGLGLAQRSFENGLIAGEKITPISSVGLFVPSGKASYPSVACQLGVPAVVAGVQNIVLVVPPIPGGNGEVDPAVLVVCRLLGITNVFRINGPAGIAAIGFGTETIPRVRKVVGPGSPAVTLAQVEMQRHGLATMMLLGPTESLVVADHTAHVGKVASDLLIEAEHGTDSSVVLVSTSEELIDAVEAELQIQLTDLPDVRAEACRASLGPNGGAVLVSTLNEAVEVVNMYAPEHCQIAVDAQYEERVVDAIVNAGEILIGQHTPFSAGNFIIGAPASLPTSGFAHVSSGITVEAFLKRTAIAQANEPALRRMADNIIAFADHEGFSAHGNAIRRRFQSK
jgi:histidinol dehydrogenase